jgi:O-antigen ligase
VDTIGVGNAILARPRARAGASRLEQAFTVLALVVFVSMPFIVGDQPQGAESLNPLDMLNTVSGAGDQLKQVILLGMYGAFAALLLAGEQPRALLFIGAPLLLLLVWTAASSAWSVNPDVTVRRCIALLGTVAMGLHFGLRFDLRRLLVTLCVAGVVVLGASLVLAVAAPSLGLDFEGRLRGVTAHKNGIGSFAAMVAMAGMGLFAGGPRARLSRALPIAALGLAAVCMAWAHSTSVIPVLALAFLALAFGRFLHRAGPGLIAWLPFAATVLLLGTALVYVNAGELAELLGKDPNMSGRTLVWAFAAKMIALRPVAGYGLGAFWVGADSPGAVFWATSHLAVPHAHNGYIQLMLELGGVGLALFATSLLVLGARLFWLIRHVGQPLAAWPLGFLAFYLVANMSESWLWIGNELLTAFFVAVLVRTNILYRSAVVGALRPSFRLAGAVP